MSTETGLRHGDLLDLGAPRAAVPLLDVDDLQIDFVTANASIHAVRGLSFELAAGESLGLVGESGSGKSVSALSILGLLPRRTARVARGSVRFEGRELVTMPESELRKLRARRMALVFQDPLSSLNPVLSIGRQITEVLETHGMAHGREAWSRAIELIELVGIPEPARRVRQHPHELSGGMRQRAMIAMALSCRPSLLIADEPTTALDVTIQAQILELLEGLREQLGMSLLLITHNLGVVARFTERVAVMYAGRVVETGPTADVLAGPNHPYTLGLLRSVPRLDGPKRSSLVPIPGLPPDPTVEVVGCAFRPRCPYALDRCVVEAPALVETRASRKVACFLAGALPSPVDADEPAVALASDLHRAAEAVAPVLEVRDLKVWFPIKGGLTRKVRGWVRAVDGVSFSLERAETLALVGESGSGKTTVARAVVRANEPQEGTILSHGVDLLSIRTLGRLQPHRRKLQMVFQDPYSSLDPRRTVGQILSEPLSVHNLAQGAAQRQRIDELLTLVGLSPSIVSRYPHEFSGGQRQRIGIARALAVQPDVIVCDEPISALDVSIQAQIVNLLEELQVELGVAYLFIAHDLAVVRHLAHRVAVMYLGRIVEMGRAGEIYEHPLHPYTSALLSAVPVPDARVEHARRRIVLSGDVPSPVAPPTGCTFHPRCPLRTALGEPELCSTLAPPLVESEHGEPGHVVACHFAGQMTGSQP